MTYNNREPLPKTQREANSGKNHTIIPAAPFQHETDGIPKDLIKFDEADLSEIIADAVEVPTKGAAIVGEVSHRIQISLGYNQESGGTNLDTRGNTSVPLPAVNTVDTSNRPLICNEQHLRITPNTHEKTGFFTECIKKIRESYLDSRKEAKENLLFSVTKLGGSLVLDSILNIPVYLSNLVLRPVNFVFRKICISPIKALNYLFNRSKFTDINNLELSPNNKKRLTKSISISQLIQSIKRDGDSAQYLNYTQINSLIMDEDLIEYLDLKTKTTIMTAKLFSIAIRENYDDGIYREKFFKLTEKLMKILDNYQKIEYFATEEFFMKDLEEIDIALDEIDESRIKCENLERRYLKNLESDEIQTKIKSIIKSYIIHHEETFLFDIYDYQNEAFLNEIFELSTIETEVNINSELKERNLNFNKDQVLGRLYAYSQEEKLRANKELLISLATSLVEIINMTSPKNFLDFMQQIFILENQILNIIDSN